MSDLRYPVPWDVVLGLGPHIRRGSRTSVDEFSAAIAGRIRPEPLVHGIENLPDDSRFVLAANHYQRKGLWILHSAAVITQTIRKRYGPGDSPVRWIVTSNWPRMRIGPWHFQSPGDWLLPRVAHTLDCYPMPFAGSNPALAARSLRSILRDAPQMHRPLGLFPEGVAGTARALNPPLAGIERLLAHLAKRGFPVQPVAISEDGRLVVRFGKTISADEAEHSANAATLVMSRIASLF